MNFLKVTDQTFLILFSKGRLLAMAGNSVAPNVRRVVLISVVFGIGVPIIWLMAYWIAGKLWPGALYRLIVEMRFDQILLVIWPSSLLLMGDPTDTNYFLAIVSISINGLYYAVFAFFSYVSFIHRSKVGLVAVVLSLSVIWFWVLTS